MAALTADRETTRKEDSIKSFPVAATTQIYKGSLVMLNSAGYLVPGADISGAKFAGVAYEKVLGGAAAGDKWCKVYRTGVFDFAASGLSQANVGDPMYMSDDQTFALASAMINDITCGVLVEYISATRGWLDIGARIS